MRSPQTRDSKKGLVKKASATLDAQMSAMTARTYGEFLYNRMKDGRLLGRTPSVRVRRHLQSDGAMGNFEFFPERKHFFQAFEAIWA